MGETRMGETGDKQDGITEADHDFWVLKHIEG